MGGYKMKPTNINLAEYYGLTRQTIGSYRKVKPRVYEAMKKDYIKIECKWSFDEDSSFYQSECGFNFMFSDDRAHATDFDFIFCPKCGGKING